MSLLPILPWWLLAALMAVATAGIIRQLHRNRHSRAATLDWAARGLLLALLFAAALRPGVGGVATPAAPADVDVFLVVDTTSSIAAEDFGGEPRLAGVQRDVAAVAAGLAGARFALITFDAAAVVRLPLTTDAGALDTAAGVLAPEITDYARGSSITAAGPVLAGRLQAARDSHPERLRYVFYLGDGEQTSASPAGQLAVDRGLVDGGAVLGYGTADGGRMRTFEGGRTGSAGAEYIQDGSPAGGGDAVSRIDEDALRSIADTLGVPYVHRTPGDTGDALLNDANPGSMEVPDTVGGGEVPDRGEVSWLLALAAFAVGLRELVFSTRRLRNTRLPAGGEGGRA